jgi:type IV secretion system protein VirB2
MRVKRRISIGHCPEVTFQGDFDANANSWQAAPNVWIAALQSQSSHFVESRRKAHFATRCNGSLYGRLTMEERRILFQPAAWGLAILLMIAIAAPDLALGQSTDPFESGANNLVTSLTTLATPIAVILVMALGVAAAAGRISWGWPIGILIGVGLLFAAPTMVTFLKGLFSS